MDFQKEPISVDYLTFNLRNGKNQIQQIVPIKKLLTLLT